MEFLREDIRVSIREEKINLVSWTGWQLSSEHNIQWPQEFGNQAEIPVTTSNPHRKETEKGKVAHQVPKETPTAGRRTCGSKENVYFFNFTLCWLWIS